MKKLRRLGREPKGLLVVNTFRETKLSNREGNSWPGKTLDLCKQQGFCAMTSLQLLGLYLDALKRPKSKDKLIQRIFRTKGEFPSYKEWTNFLLDVGEGEPEDG